MEVIEKAKELAQTIMEDERCRRLQVARAANDNDIELQKLIGEFNLKKIALGAEFKKTPPDKEKAQKFENEMKELYAKIMANPTMAEYTQAKKDMDELLTHINSIIQMSVSGEVSEGSCSGNCEGCAGCH